MESRRLALRLRYAQRLKGAEGLPGSWYVGRAVGQPVGGLRASVACSARPWIVVAARESPRASSPSPGGTAFVVLGGGDSPKPPRQQGFREATTGIEPV